MKRIALFISLLLVISLSACEPAPAVKVQYVTPAVSSTVQTSETSVSSSAQTPEPSLVSSAPVITDTPKPSQSSVSVIFTDKQKYKIEALLTGALNMSDYCTDNATFFHDVSSLSTDDFLEFVYVILDNKSDSIG